MADRALPVRLGQLPPRAEADPRSHVKVTARPYDWERDEHARR